jgi:RNA polymerase sigma-70 factor, ECF subfamily
VGNDNRPRLVVAAIQFFDARALCAPKPDLAEASDSALARALIAGEPQAFREAWSRFSPVVRRILRRSLGPERDVEDTIQDVFLCVFNKVQTLRDPGALKAFVISVTVRTLRYEIRRRRVRNWLRFADDLDVPDLRSVHPDPDSREALVRFNTILDRINSRDRTAFVLHIVHGLDLPEVAHSLGVSVPTTRRCVVRAKERVALFAGRDPLLVNYLGPARASRGRTTAARAELA